MANILDNRGNIIPDEPDAHIHACYFLLKNEKGADWETLLSTPLAELDKRVKAIIDAANAKSENLDAIMKSSEFIAYAKATAKYTEFVKKVTAMKSDPKVGDDEVKKAKKEAAALMKELAKEFKAARKAA